MMEHRRRAWSGQFEASGGLALVSFVSTMRYEWARVGGGTSNLSVRIVGRMPDGEAQLEFVMTEDWGRR